MARFLTRTFFFSAIRSEDTLPYQLPRPLFLIMFFLFHVALLSSCSTQKTILIDETTFTVSDMDANTFFDHYSETRKKLHGIAGRANAQISEPGHTERAIISFQSDRSYSLLTLRNNLGMEGGRIFSDPDSVLIYDRLQNIAHMMSQEDASRFYLNGISAMNLLLILDPIGGPEEIHRLHSNETSYLVETVNGFRHVIDKDGMVLKKTNRLSDDPHVYSTFLFENFAHIEGIQLPRRIQILSSDKKSNIFLIIRSFEINPPSMSFDPDIPEETEIIRI